MAIPLPGPIGDTLGQGIDAGFSGVNQLLQPYFNRKMQQAQQQRMAEQFQKEQAMRQEQQQRLAQQFQQDFALRQQGEQRKGSLMPLQEQLLQKKINAQRPEYMAQQAKEFMNAFGGPEAMNNPIMRGLLKHKFGIDLDRESPDVKESRKLDTQLALAKGKIDINNNENNKKDLKNFQKSLEGTKELIKIAKNNPSMFGHNVLPGLYAKTTKNKDFGKWQDLIADRIAGLEGKLSSRGNVTALKMAASLKPTHEEQQNVALGKLESMQKQLEDEIKSISGNKQKRLKYNPETGMVE